MPVLAAAALAATSCGTGGSPAPPPGPTDPPTTGLPTEKAGSTVVVSPDVLAATSTTAGAAATTGPPAAPAEDLATVTAIPPLDGFSELPGGPGIGPLDLTAASDGDAREREALRRFRFVAGHARGFVKGPEEIVVTVFRFSSPTDAQDYLKDTVDSSLVSNGSFLFGLPVAGGTGYREQGAGKDGEPYVTYGALFVRGDRCFEQLIRSPAAGPERSEADAQLLARRQADLVGG